ncbi:hypothetical protein ISS39_07410 [Candidatus Bathyarchaeota archaeon]|nr:hypothetical protein [Candidatus Bathyarchaeota archaeon]
MNQTLQHLGLRNWKALWDPDPSQPNRGQVLPRSQLILVHDEDPDAARETLIHEALEIKLRGVLRPYREAVNSLIQAFEKITYQQKEDFLDDLAPLVLKAIRADTPEKI